AAPEIAYVLSDIEAGVVAGTAAAVGEALEVERARIVRRPAIFAALVCLLADVVVVDEDHPRARVPPHPDIRVVACALTVQLARLLGAKAQHDEQVVDSICHS